MAESNVKKGAVAGQAKPKLSELHKLVRPHVTDQWEDLSIELELGDEDDGQLLDRIKTDNSGDPLKCFTSAIKVWLQGKGRQPATWETLYTGLKEVQQTEGALRAIEESIFKVHTGLSSSIKVLKPESSLQDISMAAPPPILPAPLQDASYIPISAPPSSFQTTLTTVLPNRQTTADVLSMDLDNPDAALSPRRIDFSLKLDPPKQVRDYQWELAAPGMRGENYIIVAPTGSGKTLVAALVISKFLQRRADLEKKVIFVVNTRPLAEQQTKQLDELIPGAKVQRSIGDDVNVSDVIPYSDIIVCTAGKLIDEMKRASIGFKDIGLLVMDECHHTRKQSLQANIMTKLLQRKYSPNPEALPQVIGLTASPGAGDNPNLDMDKTLDHLITLCALMNATSGIKVVEENQEELGRFTNKPTFSLEVLDRRSANEPVVACIVQEMVKLEETLDFSCPFRRWSQEYETKIMEKKHQFEVSLDRDHRNEISTLNLLRCYSGALNIYMDLRFKDAVSVLSEFDEIARGPQANEYERNLVRRLDELVQKLTTCPLIRNPLLLKAESILYDHFQKKRDAKGVFFVRTKQHASAICEWISELPNSRMFGIRPQLITGHARETGRGMTQVEQEAVMESFRDSRYNVLVATSVAEEGLDVPACNLVIRFQHVSNEIAKTQTIGRARAEDSEGFTILSSDSKKTMQEIKNDELLALVEKSMQYFPKGDHLTKDLCEAQESILREKRKKEVYKKQKSKENKAEDTQLLCKRCKTLACNGSDIRKIQYATQFIVPKEEFKRTKIIIKPHSKPQTFPSGIEKNHKIYCHNCEADWGVLCTWPEKGVDFPTLKCKSFAFYVNKHPHPVKKWSDAPFEIPEWTEVEDQHNSDED